MKEKRITLLEREDGPNLERFIEMKCWRLLGAFWKKKIIVFTDLKNGDLVMQYE